MIEKRVRLTPEERKNYILCQGHALAAIIGVQNVNRKVLSDYCEIQTSTTTIRAYFPSNAVLRQEISEFTPPVAQN